MAKASKKFQKNIKNAKQVRKETDSFKTETLKFAKILFGVLIFTIIIYSLATLLNK